jgi:putative N6-adenine-specific DNA methylase
MPGHRRDHAHDRRGYRLGSPVAADALSALAVTAPGLAPFASQELLALGIAPHRVGVEGASFETSAAGLYAANLWLRTASRVLVRIASFEALSFHELERRARGVDWARYVTPAVPIRLRVTCRKSRLYHSDAVADRVGGAIVRAGGAIATDGTSSLDTALEHDGLSGDAAEQLVVVRLYRDQCTISLDSSGVVLHRRGYRLETAKAPLRETLAAGVLMAAGWSGQHPLLDPLCGAGTLVIEAALVARGRAPGLGRTFAFMRWPQFEPVVWDELVASARSGEKPTAPVPIQASDRDAGAVAATRRNAERAGVVDDIELSQRPVSGIRPPEGPGWLITNPPYGVRVSPDERLRDLYVQIGDVARARCAGWTVGVLSADSALARLTRLPFVVRLRTSNGGIPVEVLTAEVPVGSRH